MVLLECQGKCKWIERHAQHAHLTRVVPSGPQGLTRTEPPSVLTARARVLCAVSANVYPPPSRVTRACVRTSLPLLLTRELARYDRDLSILLRVLRAGAARASSLAAGLPASLSVSRFLSSSHFASLARRALRESRSS